MEGTNAAATLSLQISTGDSEARLKSLTEEYVKLRSALNGSVAASGLASVGTMSKEVAQQIKTLETQVAALQAKLGQKFGSEGIMASYSTQIEQGRVTVKKAIEGITKDQIVEQAKQESSAREHATSMKKLLQAQVALGEVSQPGAYSRTAQYKTELALGNDITAMLARQRKEQTLLNAENAKSVAYLSATPKGQALQNLRAAIALDKGYDTSRYAPEAISAAKTLGSIDAAKAAISDLETKHTKLAPAVKLSGDQQLKWNAAAREGHAFARGLSGSLGALWMTYGSILPLMAGAALAGGFKAGSTGTGAEPGYLRLVTVRALKRSCKP